MEWDETNKVDFQEMIGDKILERIHDVLAQFPAIFKPEWSELPDDRYVRGVKKSPF